MKTYKGNCLGAIVVALLMALPGIPALQESARESPNIVFNVNKFADGNKTAQLVFAGPGNDSNAGVTLPDGAMVLDARMNISAGPLTEGGTNCPRNLTVDVGDDGIPDWTFRGKGYGDFGHQYVFDTDANSSELKSGDDGTSTSYIQLPAGARVLNASCNVTSLGVPTTVTMLGGVNAIQSPWNIGAYRMQWLYRADEINTAGVLDKVAWRVYSGTGSGTLSNFKLFLGHTTLNDTTDTFDSNWGGETPMKVIDTDNFIITDVNGWITIDVPNMFIYNNTKNLLIEMSFSARAGTNYLLYFYYLSAGSGTRRLYNNVDYTSATGILDTPDLPVHYDIRLDFASKFCMTVDLCGDTVSDYINDDSNWNVTALKFGGALDTYMKQATVNHTDAYGNQFALVPIVVKTELGGGVNISNLSITYEYTAVVSQNPTYIGDLVEALDGLLPSFPDGKFTTIPIGVSTVQAGRVKLSNITIDYRPPVHSPVIGTRDPGADSIVMNENESRRFSISSSDEYGYPLTTLWYVDTLEVARDVDNITFAADYESAGNHRVTVTVNNTMRLVGAIWNITVQNVNRPPVVDSATPANDPTINETESINFGVVASDPDSQDLELKYTWYIGATDQNIPSDGFRFKTDLTKSGNYTVRVKVSDAGGLSVSRSWKVTVQNVNVPPVVDKLSPSYNPTIKETETVAFSIAASDFDKQTLTYRWSVDGEETGLGQQYVYRVGYDAAGVHLVQVVISDGETNISRNWTVTVDNVNRAPIPVIDQPAGKLEFMESDLINFSALSSSDPDGESLRFRWLEGAKELSSSRDFEKRFAPGVHELTLEVTDTNRAVNKTSVKFTVRFVRLVANIDWDRLAPMEGDRMTFTAWVNNTGDAPASGVELDFLVDQVSLGRQTIDSIAGGGTGSLNFAWKAKKGDHTLTVKIGGQSWNSTVTVAKKPAPPPADFGWTYIIVAIVAAAAVGGGAMLFAMSRKKRGQAAPAPKKEPATAEKAAKAAGTPKVKAGPAPAAAPRPAPAGGDQKTKDQARKLIDSTQEEIADLIENPKEGVDEMAANAMLEMAQEELREGNHDEALRLAKEAHASLAAKAAPAAAAAKAEPPAKAPAPKALTCTECGESLEPGWPTCPVCGEKV